MHPPSDVDSSECVSLARHGLCKTQGARRRVCFGGCVRLLRVATCLPHSQVDDPESLFGSGRLRCVTGGDDQSNHWPFRLARYLSAFRVNER